MGDGQEHVISAAVYWLCIGPGELLNNLINGTATSSSSKLGHQTLFFPLGFGRIGMDDSFNISVQEVHYKILLIEQILVGIVENDCLKTDSGGRMVLI